MGFFSRFFGLEKTRTLADLVEGSPALKKGTQEAARILGEITGSVRCAAHKILDTKVVEKIGNGNPVGEFSEKTGEVSVAERVLGDVQSMTATLVHEWLHKTGIFMEGVVELLATDHTKTEPVHALREQVGTARRIANAIGWNKFMQLVREGSQYGDQHLRGALKKALVFVGWHPKTAENTVTEAAEYKRAA